MNAWHDETDENSSLDFQSFTLARVVDKQHFVNYWNKYLPADSLLFNNAFRISLAIENTTNVNQ